MNTVEIVGRMILALVVVLGAMWALAKWARKPLGASSGQVLSVLARQPLSRTSSVTVVKVLDHALVLGITEQGIRLLSEVDLDQVQAVLDTPAPPRERRKIVSASKTTATDVTASTPIASTQTSTGRLNGSILSPQTWRQMIDALRELTTRR